MVFDRKKYMAEYWVRKNANMTNAERAARCENTKQNILQWRTLLFTLLGDKCVKCGFTDVRALQIDHIYGGGAIERRTHGGSGSARYRRYYKDLNVQERYQLLCANCNWIKRTENGEVTGRRYHG